MSQRRRLAAEDRLLNALACGATVEHAARQAGLSERTVYRRLADPAFGAQVAQKRAELLLRTYGLLGAASLGSVKTLVDLQHDASVPATVKRAAARDVLAMVLRYAECTDMEQRLTAVEMSLRPEPTADRGGTAGGAANPTPEGSAPC